MLGLRGGGIFECKCLGGNWMCEVDVLAWVFLYVVLRGGGEGGDTVVFSWGRRCFSGIFDNV